MHTRKHLRHAVLLGAFLALASSAGCEESSAGGDAPATVTNVVKKMVKSPKRVDKSPYGQNGDDYVLTFSEEFDGFDTNRWNDHIWYETSNPTKNYHVEYGLLKIWPQRDASGKFFNRTIDTDGKFEQTYGYFEIEAKLPRGKGTWPAFWLFAHPGKRRPEIDIMEAYPGGVDPWGFVDDSGVARPRAYAVTVWRDEGTSIGARQFDTGVDLSTRFHKYAVKWEPHGHTFYFDGKKVLEVAERMSDPMYLMVDLWFGSASGDPDETTPEGKHNSFEVNYVRAWQFKHRVERD
ncbi:MAG TPA: glycoside hydrolase family 16 protein [Noviherbaspirillum sp.]|uniref:glycoside hydrolase family 16 protein n=1 Tax=Noviherbaspirillum sp. TaxID=1926288 RepID=UPI002B4A6F1B|nr:glycoside hydrolase family 16 protein [Noviherbaspirillum sp.]HJV86986.1 glycoside hydrolase family 16 protein [Noviherbaspirillum sp.]